MQVESATESPDDMMEKPETGAEACRPGSAAASKFNKTEQQAGRKGVSSKLDAIREKYNPGDDASVTPPRCAAQKGCGILFV